MQIEPSISKRSISPKPQDPFYPNVNPKCSFPFEYKPNINDLRQLFDDSSRHHDEKKHKTNRHSSSFSDAKYSGVDDRLFESKGSHQAASVTVSAVQPIRNIEFERVKQKFDKPATSATGSSTRNKKARNFSSFLKFTNKRNDIDTNETDASKLSNSNGKAHDEIVKTADVDKGNECYIVASKKESFMSNSMNLDGLKVSDNDDDEVS